ncbi:MAG: hypothetical protein NZM35_09200 [Chitinophagales bacterium]|nr:hypothetical protein [Chitinophagales bacterium]
MNRLYISLTLAISFSLAFVSCKKDKDNDHKGGEEPVLLSANIDQLNTSAAKVVAISLRSGYRMENITNNKFSVKIDKAQPWVLVFLSSNNVPIGHIKLTNTIESLPMYYYKNDINSFNLGLLSKNGSTFIPENNLLQTSIPLTPEEKQVVGQSDDWFTASARNMDIDGNGKLDFMENNEYGLGVLYFIKGGQFTSGTTPSLDTSGFVDGFKLFVHIKDSTLPSAIYITGPAGSGFQNTLVTDHNKYTNYIDFFSPTISSQFPPGGEYTITYNSKNLKFDIPDQSYILNNIVIPWPKVNLNTDGTINNISWEMKLPFKNTTINPLSLVSKIQLQIDGTGPACQNNPQPNRLYNSPHLNAETTTHTLECQNIQWNNVKYIHMTYWDQYNQHYIVGFAR